MFYIFFPKFCKLIIQNGEISFDRPQNDHTLNISCVRSLGAGGGLMSNFEQLVRGIWKPETNELLKMT